MAAVEQQLSTSQLKQDVDKAVAGKTGFGQVFDELQHQMASEKGLPTQKQTTDLQAYRKAINEELTAKGFPPIDVQFDKGGQMHVLNEKGNEVDVNSKTLSEKASVQAPKQELPPGAAQGLHDAVEKCAQSGHYGGMFNRMQSTADTVSPEVAQQRLDQLTPELNKDLQAHGINPVDLKMGADKKIHIYDHASGKELDADTLKPKSAEQNSPTAPHRQPESGHGTEAHPEAQHKPGTKPSSEAQSDYWKQHERKDNPDGSSDIKVKQGDSLWKIAEHLCEQRLGHKMDPKNLKDMQAVLKMTKDLAAAQDPPIEIKNGRAMIKDGDSLHIPPAKKTEGPPKPGDGDSPKPGDTNPPKPGDTTPHHQSHHGKVETKDNTTTIKEDNGAKTTVATDKDGNPTDVTREENGTKVHFKKTGDHEWTDDQGKKFNGDVKLGKDGTVTIENSDSHTSRTYHPNGASEAKGADGKPTQVSTADGPHKHTYTKGSDGWTAQPGGEKFDDVSADSDGTVTAKQGKATKKMYPDGAQEDRDADGKLTYVETPEGKHQNSYKLVHGDASKGEKDYWQSNDPAGKWNGQKYEDVKPSDDGSVTVKGNGVDTTLRPDGSQESKDGNGKTVYLQTPDGPNQNSYKFVPKDPNDAKSKDHWVANDKNGHWQGAQYDDIQPPDEHGTIKATHDGTTTELRKDGSQVDTDASGHKTRIKSSDGHEYKFVKGENGKSDKWVAADNNTQEFKNVDVDESGKLTTEDVNGKKEHYPNGTEIDYDSHNRMTSVTTKDNHRYTLQYDSDSATSPKSIYVMNPGAMGAERIYTQDASGKFYTNSADKSHSQVKITVKDGAIHIEDAAGAKTIDSNGEHPDK